MVRQSQQDSLCDSAIHCRRSIVPKGLSQRKMRRHPVQRPPHVMEASRGFAQRKRPDRHGRGVVRGRVAHVTREIIRYRCARCDEYRRREVEEGRMHSRPIARRSCRDRTGDRSGEWNK
jgi:hypothetical protein